MGYINDGLVVNFMDYFSSLFLIVSLNVSFVHNRFMVLLNKGSVFLVDHGLMMFVNVLFNQDWLMMLMNNVLMMLMDDIFLMFNDHIFVVLVNNILMDFFNNGCISVGSVFLSEFVSFYGSAFVLGLDNLLFVMGDDNGLFVNLLNDHLRVGNNTTLTVVVSVNVSLSVNVACSVNVAGSLSITFRIS